MQAKINDFSTMRELLDFLKDGEVKIDSVYAQESTETLPKAKKMLAKFTRRIDLKRVFWGRLPSVRYDFELVMVIINSPG